MKKFFLLLIAVVSLIILGLTTQAQDGGKNNMTQHRAGFCTYEFGKDIK